MQRRNFVLVFFSFDTKMKGCMTTLPIDNHPRAKRRLQFIGISVYKLTLKSVNITQSSNNYNILQLNLLEPKHSSYENPGYLV